MYVASSLWGSATSAGSVTHKFPTGGGNVKTCPSAGSLFLFSVQNRVRVFFPFSNVAGVFFLSSSCECVLVCASGCACMCVCARFVMLCEQEKLCGAFHLTWLPKWQLAGKRERGNNNDDDDDGDELRTNICIMCQGEIERKSKWRQQQDTTYKSMQLNGNIHTHTHIYFSISQHNMVNRMCLVLNLNSGLYAILIASFRCLCCLSNPSILQ